MEIKLRKISEQFYTGSIHEGNTIIDLGTLDIAERTALANVFMDAAEKLLKDKP